ncbi:histidine kinase [Paraconexibacter antarcticus]|uniref:histidine kinase n=1 Tax=Paraconexibacter antarcticus TaxID=2949664 RepID=A0ABY5DZP4_9ACTN|nr:histidine kinase [Paraconexibacter antarcticus]UTI66307.1 histidine kinase [Paraconexibacter antarcticus]
MDVLLGAFIGALVALSAVAAWRLVARPRGVLSPAAGMRETALHAATATLPHLRRGLDRRSAEKAVEHLRALTAADAVALTDTDSILAAAGVGASHLRPGAPLDALHGGGDDRIHVVDGLVWPDPSCPLQTAVVAPLVVQGERVGSFVTFTATSRRLTPEDTRAAGEAASLVAAQVELAVVASQGERLAEAELRALRAQISPHFIYNALAAVASHIHDAPDEARELLTDFAEFTRYAFRGERPYVTLADELRYVESYLRLEQARFGDRLVVRLVIAPEALQAVVPVLSVQPLVENAVRHGIESRPGTGTVEIRAEDHGADVVVEVRDDGPGMTDVRAGAALAGAGAGGGIGLSNVHRRMQQTFGEGYGLEVRSAAGGGTTIVMTVPKFRAGVRAT